MARPDRTPRPSVDVFAQIAADPFRFGLFHALRLIECAFPDMPRLGRGGGRAEEEPVRIAQQPTLAFQPTQLAGLDPGDGEAVRPRLRVHGLGLFGPQGPMPLHLSDEIMLQRQELRADDPLSRFADIFHHRLFTLFYRAWADAEPTVSHDRPWEDRFGSYLASLIGRDDERVGEACDPIRSVQLHFAGRLALDARNPEGLSAMIGAFFGMPATVEEFVRAWLLLPPGARWRLGDRRAGTLGDGLCIGSRTLDGQHRFRIRLGPLTLAQYHRILPGGGGLPRLAALVRTYAGDQYRWDVRLVLRSPEVPPLRLNGSVQLGWTSWMPYARPAAGRHDGGVERGRDGVDGALIDPFAPPLRQPQSATCPGA